MKLEDSSNGMLTPTNHSPPSLHVSRNSKSARPSTSASSLSRRHPYTAHQRRQNLLAANNELLVQHSSANFSVPLLTSAMQNFFQATKTMEDEIMLPSRLKDMPVDEVVIDHGVQPNNWHELYGFVQDMRNQMTRSRPFADHDGQQQFSIEMKDGNDDEGILLASHDTAVHSSSSSTVSSDELEHSTSSASNLHPFESIKSDLKFHYFGLLASLDTLTNMANCVTEKYREDSTFKL